MRETVSRHPFAQRPLIFNTACINLSSSFLFSSLLSSITARFGRALHKLLAKTPRAFSVTHCLLTNTGVLFKPQLGERLLKIKPCICFSSAGFVLQYFCMVWVTSMEASSRPMSNGCLILPVSWTGGRGIDRPASTSGQTGINSNSLLSSSRIIRLLFDFPS